MPNFDPAWLVLTIPAAIIASGIWQSRQAEIRRRKDAREAKERIAQQNKPKPQSPDFAALIYAIATESDANRDEEKREEGGKALREKVTIVLIGLTFAAIVLQVREMRLVYDPIRQQAEAANRQSAAMEADERPWIGVPEIPTPEDLPGEPKRVRFSLTFKNVGRTAPTGLYVGIDVVNYGVETEGPKLCKRGTDRANRKPGLFFGLSIIPGDRFTISDTPDKAVVTTTQTATITDRTATVGCVVYGARFDTVLHETIFIAPLRVDGGQVVVQPISTIEPN